MDTNHIALVLSLLFAALSCLELLVFASITAAFEFGRAPASGNVKFWTPFNISLLAMACSQIGIFGCMGISISNERNALDNGLASVFLQIFIGNVQLAYCFFSWHKSQSIMKRFMPILHRISVWLLPTCPLFFYAQVIPEIIHVADTSGVLRTTLPTIEILCPLLAAIGAVLFDTVFMYIYCRHLAIVSTVVAPDPELVMVRTHGIASCTLLYLGFVIHVAASAAPNAAAYNLVATIANGVFVLVFGLLLSLKIRLRRLARAVARVQDTDALRNNIQESGRELDRTARRETAKANTPTDAMIVLDTK
ncbi:hypothetical protein HDU83_006402 [Entophlyctis luteolus]|nr:hypothetical protein HDU82_001517 [Entophlyctis luteolus]KAJ3341881.1 hypothetical protein HDU83_006402 [Entophlyctis luteolus]KAJ3378475.1 hypothetical protein HDU84_007549 [Entophlyctis sp. JEL0112]